MNIKRYIHDHETRIQQAILTDTGTGDLQRIRETHERVLRYIQHERLIHLLVTLAFGVFLLIAFALSFIKTQVLLLVLTGLFLALLFPYIFHYYFLENCVQRWYRLAEDIEKKIEELHVGRFPQVRNRRCR